MRPLRRTRAAAIPPAADAGSSSRRSACGGAGPPCSAGPGRDSRATCRASRGGTPSSRGDQLAGVDGAGPDLALRPPGSSSSPESIRRGQRRVVDEDAVDAQDVRHEVVGEDRRAGRGRRTPRPRPARGRSGTICARLKKPWSSKNGMPAARLRGEPLGRAARPRRRRRSPCGRRGRSRDRAGPRRRAPSARGRGSCPRTVATSSALSARSSPGDPRAVGAEVVGERPGDGVVARAPRALAGASGTSRSRS